MIIKGKFVKDLDKSKIIRDLKPETPDVTPDDRGSTGEVPGKLKPSSRRRTMDKEDIIRMARKAGMPYFYGTWEIANLDGLERFAALVAEQEREKCAKWADLVAREIDNTHNTASYIASGIRARGEK